MLVIGTRGSDLALTQSRWIAARLADIGVETRLEIIRTQGDRVQNLSFDKLEGKGFFTKELEEALLDKRVDLAVHSLKDLPTESPEGLAVAAIPEREDPRDCLVISKAAYDANAPVMPVKIGARVGTSAVRRQAQLTYLRPDLTPDFLRGNVPTRVERLREGKYDAVLLAQAGLTRLGLDLSDLHAVPLDVRTFIPAPAQGALGLQTRADDAVAREAVGKLSVAQVVRRVEAERRLLARLEGGCHLPLGAHAVQAEGNELELLVFFGGSEQKPGARTLTLRGTDPVTLSEQAYEALVKG